MAAVMAVALLTACAPGTAHDVMSAPAEMIPETRSTDVVSTLPRPERPLDIAVYEFPDLTGQHKPNTSFSEYSRAVTQGADAILADVLTKTGGGTWFNVIERRGLPNLLRERQIIQATRQQYDGQGAQPLSPLLFAGILLEGGIVAYETNQLTGGLGARYLGIGGNTEYQRDMVTVNLRAVSVTSGRVMASVTTTKEIYSTLLQASVFKFIGVDALLEVESGFTRNSPPQLAVREAIELAVYALVMEGVQKGLWSFADPSSLLPAIRAYRDRIDQPQRPLGPGRTVDGDGPGGRAVSDLLL